MQNIKVASVSVLVGVALFSAGFVAAQSTNSQQDREKQILGKIAIASLGSDTYHMGVHADNNDTSDDDLGKAIIAAGKDPSVTPAVAQFLISSHFNKLRGDREVPDGINTQVELQAIQIVQNKQIIDLLQKIANQPKDAQKTAIP